MDALRQHDVDSRQEASAGEKLAQALELMAVGIRLKRVSLREALPTADELEIDRAVERWLFSDG
jgi:hypothetical protein